MARFVKLSDGQWYNTDKVALIQQHGRDANACMLHYEPIGSKPFGPVIGSADEIAALFNFYPVTDDEN